MEIKLTKRQQEIFDFIKRYSAQHGYPPTVRDIGQAIGLTSSSTVHAHLANLERLGVLRRDPTKPRAMEVLVDRAKKLVAAPGVPLVGRVAAGSPILAEENIEEYHQVPPVIGGDEADFMLRVNGDSMKDAGILDGDYVVVQKRSTARDGEIVVAVVGEDEATVKRFFKDADAIRLEPENADYQPIISKDIRVEGRVIGVFRRLT